MGCGDDARLALATKVISDSSLRQRTLLYVLMNTKNGSQGDLGESIEMFPPTTLNLYQTELM